MAELLSLGDAIAAFCTLLIIGIGLMLFVGLISSISWGMPRWRGRRW